MLHRFNIKPFLIYGLLILTTTALIIACQRGLTPYPDAISSGNLSKDNNSNCEPVTVAGNYYTEQNLTDSNYLEVSVNVTSPGSYNITTDTINGYSFKAIGTFVHTGLNQIKLSALGTPLIADTDYFTIKYNTSFCETTVVVTDTTIKPALYTLNGAPDICMNDTVYGSYIKGVKLDTNAKVKISLNVTSPGIYSITTNTVNGYNFSGRGIFLNTGVQSIFLQASGTPVNMQTDIFNVIAGTSACSFSVDVLTPVTVSNDDYYPLSANSYWIYDDLINTGATIKKTVLDSTTVNNNLYKVVTEELQLGGPYNFYYRKSGADYFEYAAPNEYTTFFQYKKPVNADIPFLKGNLTTGSAWQSPEYIDSISSTNIITLKYNYSCINANATITINGKAFANVYEIKMLPAIKSYGEDYAFTNEEYLFYYAKGVGLIYLKKTLSGFLQQELAINSWKVN